MQSTFCIGDWRVDPSLRTLSGVKGEVHLEPKQIQVLALLAQHAGQVVSKERLLQIVWADTFVGDEVLSRAISELRRALDDDPKAPRFIQTIPKGGYRLVATVTKVEVASPESGAAPMAGKRASWLPSRRRAALLLVAVTAGVATMWSVATDRRSIPNAPLPPMTTVPLASLPGGRRFTVVFAGRDAHRLRLEAQRRCGVGPADRVEEHRRRCAARAYPWRERHLPSLVARRPLDRLCSRRRTAQRPVRRIGDRRTAAAFVCGAFVQRPVSRATT
jgi:DNA-binding winged helix-turn-helix (wHTH) protein